MDAATMLQGLRDSYRATGRNLEKDVEELGQVEAARRRANRKRFTTQDHIRALALSQLSNQRSWGPIAANLSAIERTFGGFDPGFIRSTPPKTFYDRLLALRCGNRQLARQMEALSANLDVFDRIEAEHKSVDKFVTSSAPESVVRDLASPGRRFKLRQVGPALAYEYLKNVGINAGKPDTHVLRILGPDRLTFFDHTPSPGEAAKKLEELAEEANVSTTYFDNVLWLFCAKDYGNVCGARPQCTLCKLADACASA